MSVQKQILLALVAALVMVALPAPAHADVGSTIFGRFWDSATHTMKSRMQSGQPAAVSLLSEAEEIFLGETQDITTMTAVRDVYQGMRTVGLILLALCTVISLAEVTEAGMMGHSGSLTDWIRRFCIAGFMTIGSIHFYGLWIRIFNWLLVAFRDYLARHWTAPEESTAALYQLVVSLLETQNILLTILFGAVTIVILLLLWFLIGGVRLAEMCLMVILAPLVWPLYLISSLEDIPKTAFRAFLGLNALMLLVVGMLHLAVRMAVGGSLGNTIWNLVPALTMLMMTIFLPSIVKRIVGQGHAGVGALTTAAYALAGLKGLGVVAAGGGAKAAAAAAPPAAGAVPQAPTGPSAYPVAPMPNSAASRPPGGSQRSPMHDVWASAPAQVQSGAIAHRAGALEAPSSTKAGESEIEMRESRPGSGVFDTVQAFRSYNDGLNRAKRIQS